MMNEESRLAGVQMDCIDVGSHLSNQGGHPWSRFERSSGPRVPNTGASSRWSSFPGHPLITRPSGTLFYLSI